MTRNRRAELQRKLGMAPLPTPPPDLAQRIKEEIPGDLPVNVEKERQRIHRSVAFDIRIAASILLLISAAFAGLYLLSPSPQTTLTNSTSATKSSSTQLAEGRTALPEPAAPPPSAVAKEPQFLPPAPPTARPLRRKVKEEEGSPALVGGISATTPVGMRAERQAPVSAVVADAASASPLPAAPALQNSSRPASATDNPSPGAVAESRAKGEVAATEATDATLRAPSVAAAQDAPSRMVGRAISKSAGRQDKKSLIEVAAFAQAERAVRRGEKLDAATAEALIEHFAVTTELASGGLRFETEAIVLPLVEPDTVFLRVSIDRPIGDSAATGIRLFIDPARDPVDRSDLSPAVRSSEIEPMLLPGTSHTRVYALRMRSEVPAGNRMASVRLRYRDGGGREQELARSIFRADVREWEKASSRGRSSSLAAALVARLQEGKPVMPLAAMARKGGLQELAELIESAPQR